MRAVPTALPDVIEIEPDVWQDARGYFFESHSEPKYAALGIGQRFVQDNVSRSSRGILRGLHLQSPPHGQGKLVQVLEGEVLDVAVDARVGSPTFGHSVSVVLSAQKHNQLFVPCGFAHGFCVLSERALFSYKCTRVYAKDAELSIVWNDPDLAIDWKVEAPVVSEKDAAGLRLRDVPPARLYRYGAEA